MTSFGSGLHAGIFAGWVDGKFNPKANHNAFYLLGASYSGKINIDIAHVYGTKKAWQNRHISDLWGGMGPLHQGIYWPKKGEKLALGGASKTGFGITINLQSKVGGIKKKKKKSLGGVRRKGQGDIIWSLDPVTRKFGSKD